MGMHEFYSKNIQRHLDHERQGPKQYIGVDLICSHYAVGKGGKEYSGGKVDHRATLGKNEARHRAAPGDVRPYIY